MSFKLDKRHVTARFNRLKEKIGLQEAMDRTPVYEGLEEKGRVFDRLVGTLNTVQRLATARLRAVQEPALGQTDESLVSGFTTACNELQQATDDSSFGVIANSLLDSGAVFSNMKEQMTAYAQGIETLVLKPISDFKTNEFRIVETNRSRYHDARIDVDNANIGLANKKSKKTDDYKLEENYARALEVHEALGPETSDLLEVCSGICRIVILDSLNQLHLLTSTYGSGVSEVIGAVDEQIKQREKHIAQEEKVLATLRTTLESKFIQTTAPPPVAHVPYFGTSLAVLLERHGQFHYFN